MSIEWTQDLSVGVIEIDNQHKELFSTIDRLLKACNEGRGREEISDVLKFLESYIVEHFSKEEQYMMKYSYSGYISHKEQHKSFMKKFNELKGEFNPHISGVHTVIATNRFVVNWLQDHIKNVDKELGAFLKDRLKSN